MERTATPRAIGIREGVSKAEPAWTIPIGATKSAAIMTPSAAVCTPLSAPAFCPNRMYRAQQTPAPKA
ncbi:hypothetical protein D3C81_2169470 [compost metagenome]